MQRNYNLKGYFVLAVPHKPQPSGYISGYIYKACKLAYNLCVHLHSLDAGTMLYINIAEYI